MEKAGPKRLRFREVRVWKTRIPKAKYANVPSTSRHQNPIVMGKCLYTQVFSPNIVAALDLDNGKIIWSTTLAKHGGECLVSNSNRLYTRTDLELVCLDANSANVLWTFKPAHASGEMFYSVPHITGNKLYAGDTKGHFYCI